MRLAAGIPPCARHSGVAIGQSSVQRLIVWAAYWNDRRNERGRVWHRRFTVPGTYGSASHDSRVAIVEHNHLALNR